MSARELGALIGRQGVARIGRLEVAVVILDAREAFGRVDVLVAGETDAASVSWAPLHEPDEFWHLSCWRAEEAQGDERPPVVVRVAAGSMCDSCHETIGGNAQWMSLARVELREEER